MSQLFLYAILAILVAGFAGFSPAARATAQIPDKIAFNGESFVLHSEPLRVLVNRGPDNGGIALDTRASRCTANWRGYRASWRIDDDRLWLTEIETGSCESAPKAVPLEAIFRAESAPIPASWFTGVLILAGGEIKEYVHSDYGSVYERYIVLVVEKGRVVSKAELSDPPQR